MTSKQPQPVPIRESLLWNGFVSPPPPPNRLNYDRQEDYDMDVELYKKRLAKMVAQ